LHFRSTSVLVSTSRCLVPRLHQTILIVSTLFASWLGMQAIHELGHVLVAWLTGGSVKQVVLHPLGISRTDLAENPQPLAVAWGGPLGGVVLPLLLWAITSAIDSLTVSQSELNRPIRLLLPPFLLRFFAGFCLLANGIYIGLGSFGGVGDCGDLLRHGGSLWQLWLFGALTAPAGLALWHSQGRHFGLGPHAETVRRSTAFAVLAVCLALLILFTAVALSQN
jgi:hypothetical protein